MGASGWIGVDLDGTLAIWDSTSSIDSIGAPIWPMVNRVKKWLEQGQEVRIVTARVACTGHYVEESRRHDDEEFADSQRRLITQWCRDNIGQILPVVCQKDFGMKELWDDRVVQVVTNKGLTIREHEGW